MTVATAARTFTRTARCGHEYEAPKPRGVRNLCDDCQDAADTAAAIEREARSTVRLGQFAILANGRIGQVWDRATDTTWWVADGAEFVEMRSDVITRSRVTTGDVDALFAEDVPAEDTDAALIAGIDRAVEMGEMVRAEDVMAPAAVLPPHTMTDAVGRLHHVGDTLGRDGRAYSACGYYLLAADAAPHDAEYSCRTCERVILAEAPAPVAGAAVEGAPAPVELLPADIPTDCFAYRHAYAWAHGYGHGEADAYARWCVAQYGPDVERATADNSHPVDYRWWAANGRPFAPSVDVEADHRDALAEHAERESSAPVRHRAHPATSGAYCTAYVDGATSGPSDDATYVRADVTCPACVASYAVGWHPEGTDADWRRLAPAAPPEAPGAPQEAAPAAELHTMTDGRGCIVVRDDVAAVLLAGQREGWREWAGRGAGRSTVHADGSPVAEAVRAVLAAVAGYERTNMPGGNPFPYGSDVAELSGWSCPVIPERAWDARRASWAVGAHDEAFAGVLPVARAASSAYYAGESDDGREVGWQFYG